ncbi:Mitochondrial division protein 1 [Smittium mucronatum]|uniref:Mitochondrial division protein 1 n=1 Tax=Smittium mucronatum TaxID=133383 RepID=A0A1R0H178_9FUNG|nr:Mitochondrial division protein 1 [Smittium mucronatum]
MAPKDPEQFKRPSNLSSAIGKLNSYISSIVSPLINVVVVSKRKNRITSSTSSHSSRPPFLPLENLDLIVKRNESNRTGPSISLFHDFAVGSQLDPAIADHGHCEHTDRLGTFSKKKVGVLINQNIGWSQVSKPISPNKLELRSKFSNSLFASSHHDGTVRAETILMGKREAAINRILDLKHTKQSLLDRVRLIEEEISIAVLEKDDIEKELALVWQQGTATNQPQEQQQQQSQQQRQQDQQKDFDNFDYEAYESRHLTPISISFLQKIFEKKKSKIACFFECFKLTGCHYSGISALDYDVDSGLVALGSLDTQVSVWDAQTAAKKFTINSHSDIIRGVQFYNNHLFTCSNDGRVRMWDLVLADSVVPVDYLDLDTSSTNTEDQDEGMDESSSDEFDQNEFRSTTPLLSPSLTMHIDPIELCCEVNFSGHGGPVTCLEAKQGRLITSCCDGIVRDDSVVASCLESFGPALVTGSSNGQVQLWDLRTSQLSRQFNSGQPNINSLTFTEFAITTSSSDGTIRQFDLRTFKPIFTIQLGGPVPSVSVDASTQSVWASVLGSVIVDYNPKSMVVSQFDPISGSLLYTHQNISPFPTYPSPPEKPAQYGSAIQPVITQPHENLQLPNGGTTVLSRIDDYLLIGTYNGDASLVKIP